MPFIKLLKLNTAKVSNYEVNVCASNPSSDYSLCFKQGFVFLILNLFDVSEGGCPEYDHHNSGCALKKLHWLFGPEHPI